MRVALDAGAPVFVKAASGAGGARLRRERERLEQAEHPGVVALAGPAATSGTPTGVAADGEFELRTWYAGEPVSRWAGSLADVAGLGAAVASTLADLHDIGVVHGRLDATHVLLGADGRPRLCGFADPGEATAADDVAALGGLVGQLSARAPDDRRGLLRSRRLSRAARRALADAVEQATDPVPARRPSARRLADAILAAVAGARLPGGPSSPTREADPERGGEAESPTPAPGGPRATRRPSVAAGPDLRPAAGTAEIGRPTGGAAAPAGPSAPGDDRPRQPDTLDRIWSFAGEPSEDERWARALGDGPLDLPPRAGESTLPMATVDTPDWSVTSDNPGGDAPPGPRPRRGPMQPAPWHASLARPEAGRTPATGHGRSADPGDPGEPGEPGEPGGPTEPGAPTDANEPGEPTEPGEPGGPTEPGEPGDGLTRDHRVAGGRVGVTRRPAAADATAPTAAPPRRRAARAGAAALVVALAIGGVLALGPGGGADSSRPESPAQAASRPCPPVAAPKADVDGDGCPEPLAVEGGTVDAGVAQWALGEPGDLIALGDWDCDGEASAALLRPASGDVFVFTAWAASGTPVTVNAIHRATGAVGLRAEADGRGCDRLMVDMAGGGTSPVEVPR